MFQAVVAARSCHTVRACAVADERPSTTQPEPWGEEGLQDVRIVEALYESAKKGRPFRIGLFGKP